MDSSPHIAGAPPVLLLWTNPKERQALFKILCATGALVEYPPGAGNTYVVPDRKYRLVVFDYDTLKSDAARLLAQAASLDRPPPVLVLTSTRDKKDLVDLFAHEVLTNLVAKNTDVTQNELVVTVQKIMRNEIFGLEKYLTWGIAPVEERITCSKDKEAVIGRLTDYLNAIGCNSRLVGLASGVGDEFLMNAVYNAPVDQAGRPKYASRPRSERVDLTREEVVRFRYACDGRTLAVSVEDNFGRLEKATVLSYLRKCFMKGGDQIDDKQGGAGLGLYYIFESLNSFIINVAAGKKTEMIGLMDISGTYREFAERPKSLNIFLREKTA